MYIVGVSVSEQSFCTWMQIMHKCGKYTTIYGIILCVTS